MINTSRSSLVASMAVMLSQIAMGMPGSVRKLMAIAGITQSDSALSTRKRTGRGKSPTIRRRCGKKLHHRQKR